MAALGGEPGIALVVLQHLDPTHPSALAGLLDRVGPLEVVVATDGQPLERNVMYVAPPAKQLRVENGRLALAEHEGSSSQEHRIDRFMESLAADAGHRAVAVLLSGSGSDGRRGLTAIRRNGGLTFAQDESAAFDAMPRSAIAAGVVDSVLSPQEIAHRLLALSKHAYLNGADAQAAPSPTTGAGSSFAQALALLNARRGVDFSGYKAATLRRRIERRMALCGAETTADYVRILQGTPQELDALYEDLLINVTEFFRDPDAFEVLTTTVLPRLLHNRTAEAPLRIWSVGCSTGQEPYSIAICVLEALKSRPDRIPVKIFATDVSERSLEIARRGLYRSEECAVIDPQQRARFFEPEGERLRVRKPVRDLCVFARHDVTQDPPFSGIDLVCCRNLLIYLDAATQARALQTLHYALRPGGVLMLGQAESVGSSEDAFEPLAGARQFYERKPSSMWRMPKLRAMPAYSENIDPLVVRPDRGADTLERRADALVVAQYAPAGVIVDQDFCVHQFRGDTSPYLATPAGPPTNSLLKLAHEDVLPHLSAALSEARSERVRVHREGVRVREPHGDRIIDLWIDPLEGQGDHYLVSFDERATGASRRGTTLNRLQGIARGYSRRILSSLERRAQDVDPHRQQLTSELALARQRLHALVEEHDAKAEELKAAHEEVLSSNEELQSTNEELQTTKEEVQATNEELNTVNMELEARNRSLGRLHDDLTNLLDSTMIPIVMVGPDRRIRSFTPAGGSLLNLIPGDIGRPLEHIKPKLHDLPLTSLLDPVFNDLEMTDREVRDGSGRWYRVTARPYRTSDGGVDGAVLAVADIDQLKRVVLELRDARDYAQNVVESAQEGLMVVDANFQILTVNSACATLCGVDPPSVVGEALWDIHPAFRQAQFRPWLVDALEGRETPSVDVQLQTAGGPRELRLRVSPIGSSALEYRLLISAADVTAENLERRLEARLTDSILTAQAEEREHLAQELHDETGQALSALLVGLRSIEEGLEDPEVAEDVRRLRERVRELVESVRRMAKGLHPTVVVELGLAAALRALVDQFNESHPVQTTLHIDDAEAFAGLPLPMGVALYRVVQEALTNVVRHSQAPTARVEVRMDALCIEANVHDDGKGFDTDAGSSAGLGLRLMRRRVAQLGGVLTLESTPRGGTRLSVRVPLPGTREGG